MLVNVTTKDITKGLAGIPGCCPVALALQRHTNKYIRVFGGSAAVDELRLLLPKNVQEFIAAFDLRRPVKPFSFEIDL